VIAVQNGRAIAPDCSQMQQPSTMGMSDGPFNLTPRPSVAFGCATYGDLAKMIVNPQDLVQPKHYPGQSATTANAAVQRYNTGTITPLLTNGDTSNVSNGSTSSSNATGASSQGTGSGASNGATP
jgi:type IV pilus biogenesis protein CpaD/CtpE